MARTEWTGRTVTDVVGMGGSVKLDEELVARAQVADWLDERNECYDIDGPQDAHDSWTITWRDLSVQGYYTEDDGTFEWSVSSSESGDYLDGDADVHAMAREAYEWVKAVAE